MYDALSRDVFELIERVREAGQGAATPADARHFYQAVALLHAAAELLEMAGCDYGVRPELAAVAA